jgi:O-antigen ligase
MVVFFYFISGNRYLDLAPDYNKAIVHHEFSTLLEATPQGKDISTMERVYRWVAGVNMVGDRYLVGFGPAGFYSAYKPYTLNQFTTYVSDNPERSTIHNYYLMTAVEQGIPGLLFFLILVYLVYLQAQKAFNSRDAVLRRWGIAAIWSFTSIIILLFFNDMLETDKVGSYFFINIAILVRLNHMRNPE